VPQGAPDDRHRRSPLATLPVSGAINAMPPGDMFMTWQGNSRRSASMAAQELARTLVAPALLGMRQHVHFGNSSAMRRQALLRAGPPRLFRLRCGWLAGTALFT
jgi:hypothetical protein